MSRMLPLLVVAALAAASCGADSTGTPVAAAADDRACTGGFVAHELDHTTSGATAQTTMFDGTGAGVAAGDLDGDRRTDLVFANLSGESSIFWNNGDLTFERQPLTTGRYRQPAIVDVDDDGRLDVVMTTGVGSPVLLTNLGQGEQRIDFDRGLLDGVDGYAYSMAWGDFGGDGDLDLVTGSYNAELTQNRAIAPLLGSRSGVFAYEAEGGTFSSELLTKNAQALVVRLQDLDMDGLQDIMVGNDLATPDASWLAGSAWVAVDLFPETTFSTMSMDGGDIDNDGDIDLFATDMHPMTDDPDVMAAWEPIFEDMAAAEPTAPGNQKMENVLLSTDSPGVYDNVASDLGITFTGWSWSGLFGDLDNDGFLDIYVVNGMTADSLFPDLPDNALVEENQAFRNLGDGSMEAAPDWGLADTSGGRGMVMVDLDDDGDLDIVVNNLDTYAKVYENRVCGGNGMTVELDWEGNQNRPAFGATIEADLGDGMTLTRTVDATRGYLSTGSGQTHFGLGDTTSADLRVTWPDGATTEHTAAAGAGVVRITRTAP